MIIFIIKMLTKEQLLDHILKAAHVGEATDWEFKSALVGFPESFWDTYSAMANTDGGTVVLGAKEKAGGIKIEGLTSEQINAYQKKLWDDLNNPSKVNRNILSPGHIRVLDINEKHLLAIHIPRAGRTEGPIFIGFTPFGNTYRRCHEGDYHCSDDQIRRMLADASSVPADYRILKGFTAEDLDPLSLEQYRQRFSGLKPNHPWHSLPLIQFLEMLGGWRKDRENGEEGLTLAGLLMFGRHHSIISSGILPSYFVDYREKLDPEQRWNHRIYPDGTWEPNLFQFYQRIWPHFSADLKVPFHLDGIQRIDDTPVHKALREALVNALIHSDYAAPGGVIIERYRDRFILDNPGTLLVSFEQLRRGGISECRNKALQAMFTMIGGGEKAGSGIHRIQKEWKDQHWRAPAFTVHNRPDRIRLILPMISLIPETTLVSLERRYGQQFRNLKTLEVLALTTAEIEGEVSNSRLQELVEEHPVEITQVLQSLCEKGMLRSDNRGRWSRYQTPNAGTDSLLSNSPHLAASSPHLAASSPHLAASSPHSVSEILESLAKPIANSKRAPKVQVRLTILDLCNKRYLNLPTIARLLNRNQKSLQNHYLTALVTEGLLELRYPETPSRPDQAYITKQTNHTESAQGD